MSHYKGHKRGGSRRYFEQHRINNRIKASEVQLVDENGEMVGVVPLSQALSRAEEAGLDLVEVAPNAKPPVCKIMDYGKFKYLQQKKEAKAKKKRTEITVKELRIRYITDVGDLETKIRRAREFLEEGNKVKFTMRFKGREVAYLDMGLEKFNILKERLSDIAEVDGQTPLQGNQMQIIFSPKK
ncbi:MAG: translation initiation factor IF-3, partial [Candidatus Dadabacteria bacterium]